MANAKIRGRSGWIARRYRREWGVVDSEPTTQHERFFPSRCHYLSICKIHFCICIGVHVLEFITILNLDLDLDLDLLVVSDTSTSASTSISISLPGIPYIHNFRNCGRSHNAFALLSNETNQQSVHFSTVSIRQTVQ